MPTVEDKKPIVAAPTSSPAGQAPAMDMDRLTNWIANRDDAQAEKYAAELLDLCGELVVDGVLYRVERASGVNQDGTAWSKTKIVGVPREFLSLDRASLARGIDSLVIDHNPNT